MSDTLETEVELKVEHLDDYIVAATAVVEELRDFLAQHHADLVKPPMTMRVHGEGAEMPAASKDPAYAAEIYRYRVACDAFVNGMRGVY